MCVVGMTTMLSLCGVVVAVVTASSDAFIGVDREGVAGAGLGVGLSGVTRALWLWVAYIANTGFIRFCSFSFVVAVVVWLSVCVWAVAVRMVVIVVVSVVCVAWLTAAGSSGGGSAGGST
jgi:hypothetical protein